MWVGERVHLCIKTSLENLARGIPVLPVEEIVAITRQGCAPTSALRADGAYTGANPKNACGLFEHEYRIPVTGRRVARHGGPGWTAACATSTVPTRGAALAHGARPTSWRSSGSRSSPWTASRSWYGWTVRPRIRPRAGLGLEDRAPATGRTPPCNWPATPSTSIRPTGSHPPGAHAALRAHAGVLHEDAIGEKALDEPAGLRAGSIADMQSCSTTPPRNLAREDRFAKVARRDACSRCGFLKVCRPVTARGTRPGVKSRLRRGCDL